MWQIIELLLSLVIAIFVLHVAFVMGFFVIERFKGFVLNSMIKVGLSVFLGYGLLGYVSLVFAFFGPLNKKLIGVVLLLVFLLGFKYIKILYSYFSGVLKSFRQWSRVDKLLFFVIILFFIFYLSTALTPPYRTDALSYHLPEAMTVAQNGINISFISTPGNFFTNLPILMEVFYGMLFVLSGFLLIHVTHYFIVLAGLFVIFNFVKEIFGRRTALFAVLLIFTLYEFFVNATSAYIDAATASFEIAGLLVIWLWLKEKNNWLLTLSGIFYGFALSVKYNAMYGTLVVIILLLINLLWQKRSFKSGVVSLLYFGIPLFFVCGFWYSKNLILLSNPIYPFYFGHIGFAERSYSDLKSLFQMFGVEKTIFNFFSIPTSFFLSSYYIFIFLSFFAWPVLLFSLLRRKWKELVDGRLFIVFISGYIMIYLALWFFMLSQQVKFLFVPMILLLVVLAVQINIILTYLSRKINHGVVVIFATLFLLAVGCKIVASKNNYFFKVKKADILYNLAIHNEEEFYVDKGMGDIYKLSNYLNINYHDTLFLNSWGSEKFFLKNGNLFVYSNSMLSSGEDVNTSSIKTFFINNKIRFAVVDYNEMENSFNSPVRQNSVFTPGRDINLFFHNFVINNGVEIYKEGNITLYDLDYDKK